MVDKNNFNCNFKENVGKVVVILAKKIAAMEVNSSCPLFAYQPEIPESVKKLRKFFQSCKSTHYNCEFDRHQIQYKYIDKSTRCCIMVRNKLIKGAA